METTTRTNVDTCSQNVPGNINLVDVENEFIDRKDSRKQTFRHFSQNYL